MKSIMTTMNLLYIGVCKESLEEYYPSYIRGEFLKGTYAEDKLVDAVIKNNINVLMVDVFSSTFTLSLLQRLKGHVKLINCLYQSIAPLINLQDAESCGIEVKKLPDDIYCNEVAEYAVAQLLCACKGIIEFNGSIKSGEWNQVKTTNISIRGKTLGIVGFGNIGKKIIKLVKNWEMDILVTRKHSHLDHNFTGVTFVDFPVLIQNCNFIVFALPLTSSSFHMFNKDHVELLKTNSIIINISRGNVVDERAIHEALESGNLYRYCTDVFSQEPINSDNIFLKSDKTILSPHVAWATEDTLKKAYSIWFDQIEI
jgi:glycerate dehydrogenase